MKIITSKKFRIDMRDFLQGLLIAALSPVLVIVQKIADSMLEAGKVHFTVNPKELLMAAVGGGLAYLVKKFMSSSKIIIKKPDADENI